MTLKPISIQITADPTDAEAGFERVQRSLKGLDAATDNYQRSLAELSRAQKAGLITARGAEKSAERLAQDYQRAAASAAKFSGATAVASTAGRQFGQVSNRMRGSLQNTAFQVQDLAVQIGAGTSATQALSQQLPQLLGGFGLVGAAIGAVVGVGGALATTLMTASDEAENLEDQTDRLKEATEGLTSVLDLLSLSLDEAEVKFGNVAESVLELGRFQAQLKIKLANDELREQNTVISDLVNQYTAATVVADEFGERIDISENLRQIKDDFGLVGNEAQRLRAILAEFDEDATLEQQKAALQDLQRFMEETASITKDDLPPALAAALDQMITLSREADYLRQMMEQAAAASGEIGMTTGTPLTDDGNLLPPPSGTGDDEGGGRRRGGGGGGSSTSRQVEERIGALARSLATEDELLETWREESLEKLAEFNELELELLGGHAEAKRRIEEKYREGISNLADRSRSEEIRQQNAFFRTAKGLMQSENKKLFKIGKAVAIAETIIKAEQAIVDSYQYGAAIGGPPVGAAMAAIAAAATAVRIQKIASTEIGGGGGGPSAGGGGGGGAGAAAAASQPQGPQRPNVELTLIGDGGFSREQVVQIAEAINDGVDDGTLPIRIRGRS